MYNLSSSYQSWRYAQKLVVLRYDLDLSLLHLTFVPQLLVSVVISPPLSKFPRLSEFQEIEFMGQTDRQTDRRTDEVQHLMRPLKEEEGNITTLTPIQNRTSSRLRGRVVLLHDSLTADDQPDSWSFQFDWFCFILKHPLVSGLCVPRI